MCRGFDIPWVGGQNTMVVPFTIQRGQFSIRGVNIPWMKIEPGINLPWGSKYHMTPVSYFLSILILLTSNVLSIVLKGWKTKPFKIFDNT
jgi:hypothetical protein